MDILLCVNSPAHLKESEFDVLLVFAFFPFICPLYSLHIYLEFCNILIANFPNNFP